MADRSLDWLNQAFRDMEQAEDSRRDGRHEWACFAAHQAAEKAVKALHLHLGQEAWGHVLAKLLVELPDLGSPSQALESPPVKPGGTRGSEQRGETGAPDPVARIEEELIEKGRVLDNFYIPTRYPNSHPEGAPFEHYGPLQSGEAIQYASEIIDFVRSQMG
jgi:HEPN domain-containing protein